MSRRDNEMGGELKQVNNSYLFGLYLHSDLDDSELTPVEFRVYAHLCRRANDRQRAWGSQKNIAAHCRISVDTVGRALKGLEARRFIRREAEHRADGSRTTDTIIMLGLPGADLGAKPPPPLRKSTPTPSANIPPPPPLEPRAEGNPLEGNPLEGNPEEEKESANAPQRIHPHGFPGEESGNPFLSLPMSSNALNTEPLLSPFEFLPGPPPPKARKPTGKAFGISPAAPRKEIEVKLKTLLGPRVFKGVMEEAARVDRSKYLSLTLERILGLLEDAKKAPGNLKTNLIRLLDFEIGGEAGIAIISPAFKGRPNSSREAGQQAAENALVGLEHYRRTRKKGEEQ